METMKIACPTCGPDIAPTFHSVRSGFRIVACPSCKLVFLETYEDEINNEFYADAEAVSVDQRENKDAIEYWSYPEFFDKYDFVFERFFEQRWQTLHAAFPKLRSLLDVGCGYGFFLDYVKDRVPTLKGLELDPKVAAYAQNARGLDVSSIPIENYDAPAPFDCITMCDVLEHLRDPVMVLNHCRSTLSDEGIIYIQAPNLVGFRLPTGHGWGLPHHIWQFGPSSLCALLEKTGFEVLGWSTGVLGVIGAYENGGPTIAQRLVWSLAQTLKIGNRLAMVARKRA